MGVKHQYKEGMFDQVDRVIYDLKNNPYSRRIMTNIYVHQDLHEMNLYPCAYSMTFNVTKKPGHDKLTLNAILNQRSNDVLAANNWNVCQYACLLYTSWSEEQKRFTAMHHPFTMPMEEDLQYIDSDPGRVRAKAYDIVLNGNEIGGGSVRIFDQDIQSKMFKVLGFTEEQAQEQC